MSTGDKPCFACRSGFLNECEFAWTDPNHESCGEVIFTATGEVKEQSADKDSGYVEDGYEGYKDIESYKDPVSTGRKRAAQMFPIDAGMVCEWAGLKFAGGGVYPIIGCIGRAASDRHHGPDKNTMNNAIGNVHRICDHCHNTWHGINDKAYGERPDHTLPFIPLTPGWALHDGKTKASTAEILSAEAKRLES